MSRLSQEIEQRLETARRLMADDGEATDTLQVATAVLAAHDHVVSARALAARMSDGIYRRGVEALVADADEDVTQWLVRLLEGGRQ